MLTVRARLQGFKRLHDDRQLHLALLCISANAGHLLPCSLFLLRSCLSDALQLCLQPPELRILG